MTEKLTKQGVRNLDSLPAKKAVAAVLPPKQALVCNHKDEWGNSTISEIEMTGDTYCRQCGRIWDW